MTFHFETFSWLILWAISSLMIYLLGWVNGALGERRFMLALSDQEIEEAWISDSAISINQSHPGVPQS